VFKIVASRALRHAWLWSHKGHRHRHCHACARACYERLVPPGTLGVAGDAAVVCHVCQRLGEAWRRWGLAGLRLRRQLLMSRRLVGMYVCTYEVCTPPALYAVFYSRQRRPPYSYWLHAPAAALLLAALGGLRWARRSRAGVRVRARLTCDS
jgi:hypothetical protein